MTIHVRGRAVDGGELVFAALLLAAGVFVLIDTATIEVPVAASNVGPRFAPYAFGALLTGAAAFVVVDILRGRSATPEESELVDPAKRMDVRRVGLLIGSVIAFAVLLEPAGYLVAASVVFAGVSITLGARRYVRVAIASIVLASAVYLFFTGVLGIDLPPGVLAGVE
jgi:putative tricarboxylic transport membrane protein